jgi:hypothetical protein
MPNPRTAFCLFCDDIRIEVGNKPSFMGIYGAEIVFPSDIPPEAPIVLPKFAIIPWLFCDMDDKPQRLTIHVYGPPGKTEIFRQEIAIGQIGQPAVVFDDSTRVTFGATLPITGMPIACEGIIEVAFETERETIRAGRLRIRMPSRPDPTLPTLASPSEVATASPPPFEQSPDAAPETKPSHVRRRPSTRRTARTPEPE